MQKTAYQRGMERFLFPPQTTRDPPPPYPSPPPSLSHPASALALAAIASLEKTLGEAFFGSRIALGTGTTASSFILALAMAYREKRWGGSCVPSSYASQILAQTVGLPLEEGGGEIDAMVDGVDFINPRKEMIKGYGGALFREKVLAQQALHYLILMQENKKERELLHQNIPIEIAPFAQRAVQKSLQTQGMVQKITARLCEQGAPLRSDNGGLLLDLSLDATWATTQKVSSVRETLKSISGVIEVGLFEGFSPKVLIEHEGEIHEGADYFL